MATAQTMETVPQPAAAAAAGSEGEADYEEADKTRPSNPEDFPNFRDFQIVKMVQHFRVVTDGSQQQLRLGFKCKTCGVTFNKTMQLLGHIRLHFEDDHTCRDCGKYFFDPHKLQVHVKAKHMVSLVKCQLGCAKYSTPNFKNLQLHYERFHFVKIRMRELRKMDEAVRNGGTVLTQIVTKPSQRRPLKPATGVGPARVDSSGEESQGPEELPEGDDDMEQSVQGAAHQQQQQQIQPAQQFVIQTIERNDEEEDGADEDEEEGVKLLTDQPEENAIYDDQMQCCVCGAIFEDERQLEMHENSHTAPLECSFCRMTFMQLSDVRDHYQSRHQAVSRPSQYVITQAGQQQQTLQQIVHNPHHLQQQQEQQQQQQQHIQHCPPTAQFVPTATNGAMTTMLVMQNGMLIPVHAIDSAQLTAVNPYQQTVPTGTTTLTQWPITATPITTMTATTAAQHHHQQQILPPVHNQIEIIPLHSATPAGTTAAAAHHGIITAIPTQTQPTLTPIQLSIKDDRGHVIAGGTTATPNGGFVINSVASIDPSFLKQLDPVLHQQQQQQLQWNQQQQQFHS